MFKPARITPKRWYPAYECIAKYCQGSGRSGAIRESGGTFGKLEAAREEEYFYKKQRELLEKLRRDQISQAQFHDTQIKELEGAIKRHQTFLDHVKEPPSRK